MITAELSYNPYIRETKVLFNNKEPRVNSLVEKYQYAILHDWVNKLPEIFHDEMNGYGFELEFTGTELDYEDVKTAFLRNGVGEDKVKITHKGVMSGRLEKSTIIDNLLNWIDQHNNVNFNYSDFMDTYAELIDSPYPLILICSEEDVRPCIEWLDAEPEIITDVSLINDTDLWHTPIVICVDENNYNDVQKITKQLINRHDVTDRQLFYIIKDYIDLNEATRTIKDSGNGNIHIIKNLDEEILRIYFEVYPVTDYIVDILKALEEYITIANKNLESECVEGAIANNENSFLIDKCNIEIATLKKTEDAFKEISKTDYSNEFELIRNNLISIVGEWRKKKTKITSEEDATKYAKEFEKEIRRQMGLCITHLNNGMKDISERIEIQNAHLYKCANIDVDYQPEGIKLDEPKEYDSLRMCKELIGIKDEYYVCKKDGAGLLPQAKKKPEVSVKVVTYYTQEWRNYAINMIKPIVDNLISDRNEMLQKYEEELAIAYRNHIHEIIDEKNAEIDDATSKLSDEEKRLQNDISWFTELRERVDAIKRD